MFSEWKLGVFSFFLSGSIVLFPTAVFLTLTLMILVGGFLDGAFCFLLLGHGHKGEHGHLVVISSTQRE